MSALSVYPPDRLSFRLEELGSHWTDFHEISHLSIFRQSCEKIKGN
jgi:hypothetical protein